MTRRGPALVLLAHGSRDPRSADSVRRIARATKQMCPDVEVAAAFLDHNGPSLDQVVDALAVAGHRDVVVAPLFLTAAFHARVDCPAAISRVQASRPGIELRLAEVLGPDPRLLAALDERLSATVSAASGSEPDALVLASAGSSDSVANESIASMAQLWGRRRGLPARVAFASTTSPSAEDAVRGLRRDGYRMVAVGSLFVAPGALPNRVESAAGKAGAVAVGAPLGPHPQLCRVILDRYLVSASTFGVLV